MYRKKVDAFLLRISPQKDPLILQAVPRYLRKLGAPKVEVGRTMFTWIDSLKYYMECYIRHEENLNNY